MSLFEIRLNGKIRKLADKNEVAMKDCAVCGGVLEGYGANPEPLVRDEEARCCAECDVRFVIPARIMRLGPDACDMIVGLAHVGRALVEGLKNRPEPPR